MYSGINNRLAVSVVVAASLLVTLHVGAVQADMPTVESVVDFSGNTAEGGNGASPTQPLAEGGDGLLYSWIRTGAGTGPINNSGGDGSIFYSLDPDTSTFTRLGAEAARSDRWHLASDGYFYASNQEEGYRVERFLPGADAWQVIRDFSYPDPDPVRDPVAVIEGSDGRLYGASPNDNEGNAIWAINKDGTGLTVLHTGSDALGSRPDYLLSGSDGRLYGVTQRGGQPASGETGRGVVFVVDPDGSDYTVLHAFDGTDGNYSAVPAVPLLEADDGRLYGITRSGGPDNSGVLYRIDRDGSGFTVLHAFSAEAANVDGRYPRQLLQADDGHLYGVAQSGGLNGMGVLFRHHMADGFQPLVAFDKVQPPAVRGSNIGTNGTGAAPYGLLQTASGDFYGVAQRGGAHGWGALFRFTPGDEVPVFRFEPTANFYMGVPSHQPEHYPPYTRWQDGSLIVQNYDGLDMRWKLENVTDCVASSDQPGSTWSGPLENLGLTPQSNGAGYTYYVHAPVPDVGRFTYSIDCKAADNGEPVHESVTLQVEPQDLPEKRVTGGGALGWAVLPLLMLAGLRRRPAA